MRTIIRQQANTDLSYGELLLANTLAAKSGISFSEVISKRVQSGSWNELAGQLGVDRDVILTRLENASTRIRQVDARNHFRHQADSGTTFTSINPHTQSARLH